MAVVDPAALQVMNLSSELMASRAVVQRQRKLLWAMAAALRAERVASTALVDLLDELLSSSPAMAELSATDRAEVVQHLQASARWLSLLGTRLAGEGEPEAAALVEQARSDLVSVCTRLQRMPASDT